MEVLKTLAYFAVFKYPLTKEELLLYSYGKESDLNSEIDSLCNQGIIYEFKQFYYIEDDIDVVNRRISGNIKAKSVLPKALNSGRFISKFPFVESVSISGALSKGYYDENGDFDFFIITTPNRLWVARTFLILYKKIFLLNSKKFFCVNYFVGNNNLTISEQNRFTATEIATLIPVTGKNASNNFIEKNKWVDNYFMNLPKKDLSEVRDIKKPFLTLLLQALLNLPIGNTIDNLFRKFTLKKWNKKFNYLNKEDFKVAMKSTKNVSKHHPQNFQKRVLDQWQIKYKELESSVKNKLIEEHA